MKRKPTQKDYRIKVRIYYGENSTDTIMIHVNSIDSECAIQIAKYFLNERFPGYEILSVVLVED